MECIINKANQPMMQEPDRRHFSEFVIIPSSLCGPSTVSHMQAAGIEGRVKITRSSAYQPVSSKRIPAAAGHHEKEIKGHTPS
jgi:hypothetical protein